MDDEIPCTGRGDILRASHVDDAKASSPASVAAELANPTPRQRLLSLARWIMKVNASKEHRPSDADAEDHRAAHPPRAAHDGLDPISYPSMIESCLRRK